MNKNTPTHAPRAHRPLLFLLVLIWIAACFSAVLYGYQHRRGILDWALLANYTPPAEIAAIAKQDSLTPAAKRILYVTDPQIQASKTFAKSCSSVSHQEQTIVLGCYTGNQSGIYVLKVIDERLNGVEQVTTAHEMLHAAYDRLSKAERQKIDGELEDYYQHDVTDPRIKATIAAYQQSEPHDVVNEMHSIFGTEIANLPAPLESYYKQYFTDRSKVTGYAAAYQAEFTSREQQVHAYDAQLSSIKAQIDADNADLDRRKAALDASRGRLEAQRDSGQTAAYNAAIPAYNAQVEAYNNEIEAVKRLIAEYNQIVAARNAIVLEEQQLKSELSGSAVPSSV